MISLILISSCVSLITIGILFIRRIRPQTLRIPSYFLGEKGDKKLFRIRTLPPRWWEIVLILTLTLGAGLAYHALSRTEESPRSAGEGLVWFDPTLSHLSALHSSQEALEFAQSEMLKMRVSEFIFIRLTFITGEENRIEPTYTFDRVSPSDLRTYLEKLISLPSSLSQPLEPSLLIKALKDEKDLQAARAHLTLVTDAQGETLRLASTLSENFESVRVIRTPRANKDVAGRRTPVIPEELAQVWSARAGNSDAEPGLPGTPHFVRIEGRLTAAVPPQARPLLGLEEFVELEGQRSEKASLALFTAEESDAENRAGSRTIQPLLTTCTLDIAGPAELDGMADLRAYAQFFRIPVRPLACRSTESSSSARTAEALDPWKYRRASIWVVPVNEYVAGELFQQNLHWIPEGFSPETDTLVYIADTRLQGTDSFLETATLQLEENQPALRLPLLPLPPAQVLFPWALSNPDARPKARPISTRSQAIEGASTNAEPSNHEVLLRAADGTPLAFKLAAQPMVVYLRTGGAAANGELGRWGQWASMWNNLKANMGQTSPLVSRIQMRTPSDWAQWLNQQKALATPPLRYAIDPQTLRGRLIESNNQPTQALSALYVRERDDQLVLVEPPAGERQNEILATADLEKMFPTRASSATNEKSNRQRSSFIQLMGALLAVTSALLLWFLQYARPNKSSAGDVQSASWMAFLLLIPAFLSPHLAEAQSTRNPPIDLRLLRGNENRPELQTHPFRIAWCDANIPDAVQQRYQYLRNLLANRGTIDLPKELLAGACRVGAAEIWWTSALEALQAAPVVQHIRSGGIVVAEGISLRQTPPWMLESADPSIGLVWESPKRRGLLYRSFYLLSSFDGCAPERTLLLTLRKKVNAQSPMGIVTPVRFLTNTSEGSDCFIADEDMRSRSFVNLMYALLTTDYKEDQMQLPEILNRVRNLGLEP